MYIYIYLYIHIHFCIFICIYTYTYTFIYTHVCVCLTSSRHSNHSRPTTVQSHTTLLNASRPTKLSFYIQMGHISCAFESCNCVMSRICVTRMNMSCPIHRIFLTMDWVTCHMCVTRMNDSYYSHQVADPDTSQLSVVMAHALPNTSVSSQLSAGIVILCVHIPFLQPVIKFLFVWGMYNLFAFVLHTYMRTCTHTHIQTYQMYTFVYTNVHAYPFRTYIWWHDSGGSHYAYIHTYIHLYKDAYIDT